MADNRCLCDTCELDRIPSGCNKSIKDMEVIKGIGVVECKHYEETVTRRNNR
jgi:hypothetical protein